MATESKGSQLCLVERLVHKAAIDTEKQVIQLSRKFLLNEVVKSLELPPVCYAYVRDHNGARVPYAEVFYQKPNKNGEAKSKKVFGKSQIAGALNYDLVCEKAIEFLKIELDVEINDISYADKWVTQVELMYNTKEVELLWQENTRLKQISLDLQDGGSLWRILIVSPQHARMALLSERETPRKRTCAKSFQVMNLLCSM
ncbi:hypothetical protein ACP70R_018863 [Stipagrostis hirtigluma subsp. patula]